jgi:hypothetical protein
MALASAYRSLFDELLAFITRPQHAAELLAGRTEYVRQTGEVFDEDRSFDLRMQGFLDWFIFDRPLSPFGEPPARAWPIDAALPEERAAEFRVLSRTVHGLFDVRSIRGQTLRLENLVTAAKYEVPLPVPMEGFDHGDFFEGRLIPHGGSFHLSPALLFHPGLMRGELLREIRRQKRERTPVPPQDLIFMLSRMANRAEHYRNVKIEAIYDFSRPPPKVEPTPLRFDRASIDRRLGRVPEANAQPAT